MTTVTWNPALCTTCRAPLGIGFDRRHRKCADCKKQTQEARQKRRAARLKEDRRLSYEQRKQRNELEEKLLAEAIKEAVIEFSGPAWHMGPRFRAKIDVKNKAVVGAHGELQTYKPIFLGAFSDPMATTKRRLVLELLEKWGYCQVRDIAPERPQNGTPPIPG
jgi:hypothetical protein